MFYKATMYGVDCLCCLSYIAASDELTWLLNQRNSKLHDFRIGPT